jgi:hypothetical protein
MFLLMGERNRIPYNHIHHGAMHMLLVERFGKRLSGRPLFILLAEAIASASDLYFFLESASTFGVAKEEKWLKTMLSKAERTLGDRKDAKRRVLGIVREGLDDPFVSFRDLALEMFSFYEFLFSVAVSRQAGGEMIDYPDFRERMLGMKHGLVTLTFDLGNNLLFAIAHGGSKSTPEDTAAVRDCLRVLRESCDFIDFIKRLGVESASEPEAEAA